MKKLVTIASVLAISLMSGISVNAYMYTDTAKGIEYEATDLTVSTFNNYDEAYRLLDLINAKRVELGAAALSTNQNYMKMAMLRAAEQSLWEGYDRPVGETLSQTFGLDDSYEVYVSAMCSADDTKNGKLTAEDCIAKFLEDDFLKDRVFGVGTEANDPQSAIGVGISGKYCYVIIALDKTGISDGSTTEKIGNHTQVLTEPVNDNYIGEISGLEVSKNGVTKPIGRFDYFTPGTAVSIDKVVMSYNNYLFDDAERYLDWNNFIFKSSDTDVVSVSNGIIYFKNYGEAEIVVKLKGSDEEESFYVNVDVDEIAASKAIGPVQKIKVKQKVVGRKHKLTISWKSKPDCRYKVLVATDKEFCHVISKKKTTLNRVTIKRNFKKYKNLYIMVYAYKEFDDQEICSPDSGVKRVKLKKIKK